MAVSRSFYSTDLTDAEWKILEPLLPVEKPRQFATDNRGFYQFLQIEPRFEPCRIGLQTFGCSRYGNFVFRVLLKQPNI